MSARWRLVSIISTLIFILLFSCQKTHQDNLSRNQKQDIQIEKSKFEKSEKGIDTVEDSLRQLNENAELTERTKEFEEKRTAFELEQKNARDKSVLQEDQKLNEQLLSLDQTLSAVKFKIAELYKKEKSIENQLVYADESNRTTKRNTKSEMSKMDSTINNLEKENQTEQKKIPILQKKISSSNTKIQAYEEEKELFEEQRIDKIRENASDSDIKSLDNKIAGINDEINTEHLNLADAKLQIANSENRITEINSQMQKLNQLVREKYDKKEVLTDFIGKETTRLKKDKEQIQAEISKLQEQEHFLDSEKENISKNLAELKSGLESLASNNTENLDSNKDNILLKKPDDKAAIKEEKTVKETNLEKLTKISEETSKGKSLKDNADAPENNSDSYITWGKTTIYLILTAFIILVVLYFLGKSGLNKKSK